MSGCAPARADRRRQVRGGEGRRSRSVAGSTTDLSCLSLSAILSTLSICNIESLWPPYTSAEPGSTLSLVGGGYFPHSVSLVVDIAVAHQAGFCGLCALWQSSWASLKTTSLPTCCRWGNACFGWGLHLPSSSFISLFSPFPPCSLTKQAGRMRALTQNSPHRAPAARPRLLPCSNSGLVTSGKPFQPHSILNFPRMHLTLFPPPPLSHLPLANTTVW